MHSCRTCFILSLFSIVNSMYVVDDRNLFCIVIEAGMILLLFVQYCLTRKYIVHNYLLLFSMIIEIITIMMGILGYNHFIIVSFFMNIIVIAVMFVTYGLIYQYSNVITPKLQFDDDDSLYDSLGEPHTPLITK